MDNFIQFLFLYNSLLFSIAQSDGAIEYTDPPSNECPGYDAQTNSEVPLMLGLWGMWSIPSLPLLPASLWPGVVAPDRALSMG